MIHHRLAAALVALTLVLSACSPAPSGPLVVSTASPAPTPPPPPAPPSVVAVAPSPSPTPQPRPASQDLAFIRDGNLWLANVDGGKAVQLTNTGRDSQPTWSPDGTRLLFVRGSGSDAELFTIQGDGRGARQLTSDRVEQREPRWAPRGGQIAYVQPRDANGDGRFDQAEGEEIWIAREDGSDAHRVADGFDPAWSPDGRRLAYATNGPPPGSPTAPSPNAIHLVNAAGQNDWELLPLKAIPQDLQPTYNYPFRPSSRRLHSPSWSADGGHLAAAADGHTGLALTVDEKGADLKLWVLNYEGGVGRPLFAPKGARLAVESRPASGYAQVVVVDTASGQRTTIGGPDLDFSAADLAWAPDGERLAVVVKNGVAAGSANQELLVFGPDGEVRARTAAGNVDQPVWNPTR